MYQKLKENAFHMLKGMGMGAANVIPGVSGGTIALITGIFERIINAIKSFNINALNLLFKGRIKELIDYVDFYFIVSVGFGMVISIVTLARVLKYLFAAYPIFIWAFFFGLILASVYYVAKTISKWSLSVVLTFIIGTAIAIFVSFMNPATSNSSFLYLILCGVVAICSMILPGLSGSFVLILMGNYELIMIDAVNNADFSILAPVVLGGAVGIVALSHFLSWIYKKFKNQTIAILSGFILGSLSILWPWKNEVYRVNSLGEFILKDGKNIVQGYDLYLPETLTSEVLFAIALMAVGFAVIALIERMANRV